MRRLEPGYLPVKSVREKKEPKEAHSEGSSDDLVIDATVPSTITFSAHTVNRTFREKIALEYPGLGKKKPYWRFLQYLCFGSWDDVDTDQLMLPQTLIASMTEKRCDTHFSARKFFESFIADTGIKIEWNNHIFSPYSSEARARTLKGVNFPSHIVALIEKERGNLSEDRVWMDSGNKWQRTHPTAINAADDKRAKDMLNLNRQHEKTRELCEYLNSQSKNRFTTAMRHLPEAIEVAKTLKDSKNQLNMLMTIREQPQPKYRTVKKSTRAFSSNVSMLYLHRDLRKILTQDWVSADLRSAQLAIVAKVWGIPEITEYLIQAESTGRNIWMDLCHHMTMEFSAANKDKVKTPLYAIIFGAGDDRLLGWFATAFDNGRAAFDLFMDHPIIRILIKARSKQLKAIRDAEGGTDAFGNIMPLVKTHKPGKKFDYDNSRSILACIAQSYELLLLLPVIQLSIAEQFNVHGFTITTFLHDGFTFESHRKEDEGPWIKKIKTMVKEQADKLGIHTELDVE